MDLRAVALVPIALLGTRPAAAEPRELRHDAALGGTLTLAGAAGLGLSELFKDAIAPATCRVCGSEGNGSVNAVDRSVRSALVLAPADQNAAHVVSTALAAALPAMALGSNAASAFAGGADAGVDALVVSEAVVASLVTNQVVKLAVGRQRPYAAARSPDDRSRAPSADDNLSFYSGHTTLAFSAVTAGATVSALRGYGTAPAMLAVGLPLATLTGGLRIAADKHYATDVLVGAVAGAAFGAFLPYVLHRPSERATPPLAPTPSATPTLFTLGAAF